jgi:[acyl-carrier-protein] S-malonyltransferase
MDQSKIKNQKSKILLCPGQGAQKVGMGQAWAEQYPIAAQTYDEAGQVLSIDLKTLCFEGPPEQLNRTDLAQAAIYVTSVACYRALRESGGLDEVGALAGLSLGEFTALHLGGAFDFASGLKLVRLRGQAMQEASQSAAGAMVALVGADEQQTQKLCDQARGDDELVPANFNCPGQVVISGSAAACDRAVALADEMGLKPKRLVVAGAFHSPLMQPAADRLAQALDQTQWGPLSATVVANVTARPHEPEPETIKRRLVEQLTNPVRWSQSMQWLLENTDGRFIELAPGKVLSGLMRRIDRDTKVNHNQEPRA